MGMVRILHLSDVHAPRRPDQLVRGQYSDQNLQRVLGAALKFPIDAVIVTGDLVDSGQTEGYERLRRTFKALNVPVRCVPGNHDAPAALRRCEPTWLDPLELDRWLIVPIDSHWPEHDAGFVTDAELARVDALTTGHPASYIVLALHHPPMAPCRARDCTLSNPAQLIAFTRRRRRTRVVLSGHQHQPFVIVADGVTFIGAPSTCVQAAHSEDHFIVTADPPGCQIVTLKPNGTATAGLLWATAMSVRSSPP
jgi:Icc protein